MNNLLKEPIRRSRLRQILGKEYYILRRKGAWLFGGTLWAKKRPVDFQTHSVFTHRSIIRRPLKDVDMYLQENKRTNLRLAIQHLDGIVLSPGETFSIWKNVGRPTQRKGYLEGLVLKQGRIEKGIGGGLCQLGNLLFWIFAHSPLTITERYRHGFDVFPDVKRTIPFGAGATLSYNHIDLQVKNETDQVFVLNLWLDNKHLNGELLCDEIIDGTYEVEERNHLITQQAWGGYTRHNQIVQVFTKKEVLDEKLLAENHAVMMYTPFLEEAPK